MRSCSARCAASRRCCCSTRSPRISTRARRDALFAALLDLESQVWLTGTDAALFAPLRGAARFLSVSDGALSETTF